MEAVIKKFNRHVDITYISPNAKNFNVIAGSYLLYTSYRYFRKNTIFLTVIDPGVGTSRKAIIIRTNNYHFVGPDNGVLYPASIEDGIISAVEISNRKIYLAKEISNTFHGRDIFSITAALISLKVPLDTFGNQLKKEQIQKLDLGSYRNNEKICTKVLYVDHFGNVSLGIKNVKVKQGQMAEIETGGKRFVVLTAKTFQDSEKDLLLYRNGYGFLELGLNKADASVVLNVKEGDEICVEQSILEDFSPFI
ncbi:SAM hydrolase/SAM-dependent halogenase family protein [Metallosphaera tengchongensis]|nr:SAM-dependent chlorinase/fluorinase [Metallosphaera tengchongensis]